MIITCLSDGLDRISRIYRICGGACVGGVCRVDNYKTNKQITEIMGFTHRAFIRKNTPELRKKLKDLGYKCNNGKWMGEYLVTFVPEGSEESDVRYCGCPEWDLKNSPSYSQSIDCGAKEELFLAIAAIRDDSDYKQWFVKRDGSFILCNEYSATVIECSHKSTVKELIKHFSK